MAGDKLSVREWLLGTWGFLMLVALGVKLVGGADDAPSLIPKADPAKQAAVVIKSSLRSPDSFEYISGKVIWQGIHKGNEAYVTLVSYNAQNGFGALIRGCAIVAFSLTENEEVLWKSQSGMQEADRVVCEHSGDGSELKDLAQSVAELNFR